MWVVLDNGPYLVEGAMLVLHTWQFDMTISHIMVKQVLLWVQIHGLPPK